MTSPRRPAAGAATTTLAALSVNRLGFAALRIAGLHVLEENAASRTLHLSSEDLAAHS